MDKKAVQSRDEGFTLIELLVVIAILALLLSVILPSLNSAKMIAKKVVCASKMRQWALAEMAYTQENDFEITPFADVSSTPNSGNALNPETYYHNRLSEYLTGEYHGKWGMSDIRRCPMSKRDWGAKAVWIGAYYGLFNTKHAPFVYLNQWDGTTMTKKSSPLKLSQIRMPSEYLMMSDTFRDLFSSPLIWSWKHDYDGDGINDSSNLSVPYSGVRAKIHRDGCNVSLFDGRVEWMPFEELWIVDSSGKLPAHRYWYNGNQPAPVTASSVGSP